MKIENVREFVRQSNEIERIFREPTDEEVEATRHFIDEAMLNLFTMKHLVWAYTRGPAGFGQSARLRDRFGMDVEVGSHLPPRGGPRIADRLEALFVLIQNKAINPFQAHVMYETLHPFTDGNGRSGRALWLKMMVRGGNHSLTGFLHQFYYQTLENCQGIMVDTEA